MADDDFTLDGGSSGVEASLDDFFQPAEAPRTRPQPPVAGFEDAPIPKGAPMPEFTAAVAEAPPPLPPEAEAAEAEPKKFLSPMILLIIVIVLALGVLGAGGYFAYNMFLAGPDETQAANVKPPPPKLDKPVSVQPEKPGEKPKPGEPSKPDTGQAKDDKKPAPAPGGKEAAKPPQAAKADKPGQEPAQKEKPAPAPEKQPEKTAKAAPPPAKKQPPPKPAPAKTAPEKAPETKPIKTASLSTGPYTIQVGSYMMRESMTGPEKKLNQLGYTDYHYVDTKRTLTVYDVFVGGTMGQQQADKVKADLEALGYKPAIKNVGVDKYKVLAYSYGSRSVANRSKAKIDKAGIGKAEVKSERRNVTLHQLRVGHFPSATKAKSSITDLKKAGFETILIKE